METQNNYKRTVAGSVGAGMGAIFNGSGRTYYILEHKTSSKYHSAGESQKIIIDQIEIGRDASCQVRYDESFDTVSRKHAAIVRDGNNWQLVHLSTSNPTLVNGRPIQGSYYLQSGDEIQLSVNGPRLGFIQPQGKQGLTSSIKLTERMNLFRQQALRPYRRAIWALSALLLLAIIGFGAWNYKLSLDNQALRQEMATYQNQVDSLKAVDSRLKDLQSELEQKLAADPNNQELSNQLNQVKQERTQVRYIYRQAASRITSLADAGFDDEEVDEDTKKAVAAATDVPELKDEISLEPIAAPSSVTTATEPVQAADNSSNDIVSYYNDIYTMKVKRISLEKGGNSYDPQMAVSNIVVGTGFVMDGKFVTARSNIQPWVYRNEYGGAWREELAMYKAAGFDVIIDFEAYSTRGAGHPLRFSNQQFNQAALEANDAKDVVLISKEVVKKIRSFGIEFTYRKKDYQTFTTTTYTPSSHNVAILALGAPGGVPVDRVAPKNLKGGEQITLAGFSGGVNIQNPAASIKYHTSNTSRTSGFHFITLQAPTSNWGYTGSPAFYQNSSGNWHVIGVNVGNFGGETRIMPISDVY
jgi:cell division protein FtsB